MLSPCLHARTRTRTHTRRQVRDREIHDGLVFEVLVTEVTEVLVTEDWSGLWHALVRALHFFGNLKSCYAFWQLRHLLCKRVV